MDETERHKYEATSVQLRADLKRFEADWSRNNAGKKPGREDIKQNPDIARKYKEYNQVRDILSGKQLPKQHKEPSKSRKRRSEDSHAQTQSKRTRPAQTPSKSRHIAIEDPTFETPSARRLFSPAVPTSIGPTPQKDGRVLGLFDLLVDDVENTPLKGTNEEPSAKDATIQATPSKKPADEMEESRLGRTPMSASKRTMLDAFMTPLKRREGNPLGGRTPNSVSKLQLSTPSFLRRAPLPALDENGEFKSPAPLRLPRKPMGRSLSSVVAGLRKLEEEKLDDDLEALHEMEDEESGSKPANPAKPAPKPQDEVLEPDSQGQQLLGGFDDDGLYDSPTEEAAVGRDGQPLRVYKKKGQKRTTRKVNVRPTRAKRPLESTEERTADDDDKVVPETQFDATKADQEPLDLGSDFELNDSEDDDEAAPKKTKAKKASKKPADKEKKEGKVQKAAKKVNELAHANFKRLKLRNNGAKGGPGFGSKFRRRR
ncbi:Uu.00g139060.m01.CDS01 [Anthostomella pinea]|uniref:DNA replication regulator SLD2 n=1 Tax=Anthostomella pinea TaxID=933095 RepID=A0AAI8VPW6_9PEZI|nr:Uu.00g139060.m01.CDS01 [Anthostomella pinea]